MNTMPLRAGDRCVNALRWWACPCAECGWTRQVLGLPAFGANGGTEGARHRAGLPAECGYGPTRLVSDSCYPDFADSGPRAILEALVPEYPELVHLECDVDVECYYFESGSVAGPRATIRSVLYA